MRGVSRVMQPIRDLNVLEEFKDQLQNWDLRNWLFFVVGISTGLRISDILPLRKRDVTGVYIRVIEKKTKKSRKILINRRLRSYFDHYFTEYDWICEDDYLFESQRRGKPITELHAWRILKRIGTIMELEDIGTHTMRKTFGYHFYQRTKDIATLQVIFNHSTQKMTMIYIGIIQENIDEAMWEFEI